MKIADMPVASIEEIREWERVCPLLDLYAAIASSTFQWVGRWAH